MRVNIGLLCLWLGLLLGSAHVSGQAYKTLKTVPSKAANHYNKAMSLQRGGELRQAISELDNALKVAPDFMDALVLQASLSGAIGRFEQAITGFKKAIDLDPEYSPRLYYELALNEFDFERYDDAAKNVKRYLAAAPDNDPRRDRGERLLANARFAAEAVKDPKPFVPENLGPSINTAGDEYLPSFTADGEQLIFTARVQNQEDFFYTRKVDGAWLPRQPLQDINTSNNEGAQSISADGRLMVFTRCTPEAGCNLFFSEFKHSKWTKPKSMGEPVNSRAWDGQPSLSANGELLFFASERPGGMGGRDIWMSRRAPDGTWKTPVNVGAPINTPGRDECPFLHADGQTIYFCSDGHPGMGKADLFVSRYEGSKWGQPMNLGYPINTSAQEGTLTVSTDGQTAYFARGGQTNGDAITGRPHVDIFSFPLYEAARPQPVTYVKAKVSDQVTGERLVADLLFTELSGGQPYARAKSGDAGDFIICLPAAYEFGLQVSKEGYFFHSENFAPQPGRTLPDPFVLDIRLLPLGSAPKASQAASADDKTAAPAIVLRNVFFATGSAELLPASVAELGQLKKLLDTQPLLRIRIDGHTDNVGDAAANQVLSEGRAQAVYDYLVAQGIAAERLAYKGFGDRQPLEANDTATGRQRNRRTEFVVLE